MLDREQSQILVLGPALWRFGERWSAQQAVLAVDLTGHTATDNTILVAWEELIGAEATMIGPAGSTAITLDTPPFPRLEPSGQLQELSRTHWAGAAAAPLFLFARSGPEVVVHALVRLGEHDGLFIRADTLPDCPGSIADLIAAAIGSTGRHREFFNNHQCCYRKFWPGDELEHKITLDGPVDLHAVTVGLRNLVGGPHLPGTIFDYRDDYQIWDFDNYMFEVLGPPGEAGYVSFIPDSTGTVIVKRKWFTADSDRRRETRWRGVSIPDGPAGYADYVRSHVSDDVRYLGSFRRTRFDATAEFTKTGNVYGFMVDWCRPHDRRGAPGLYQVELEYLHSRTLDPDAQFAVGDELDRLVAATRSYLQREGIAYTYRGESKLTYMRNLAQESA